MGKGPSNDSEDHDYRLASTAKSPKRPPQETAESIRMRVLVIASFWAVVIILGLPVWIWTTSIHRARLPLQDMLDWADGKVNTMHPLAIVELLTTSLSGLQTHFPPTDSN